MRSASLVLGVVTIVFVGLLGAPVADAAGAGETDEPSFVVELTADGDATVSLVTIYDLSDEDERQAFQSLQDDDEATDELRDRFAERMASVATSTGAEGEAVITDESIELRTDDDRGIVTVSVTWIDLATVEDGTLVLTEPFASGFETDRQLVVTGPDGSTVDETSHEPVEMDAESAWWDAEMDLNEFELVLSLDDETAGDEEAEDDDPIEDDDPVEDDDTAEETAAGDEMPGFDLVVSLLALGSVLGFVVLRARQ